MSRDDAIPNNGDQKMSDFNTLASNYYELLGLSPRASAQQIRQAYREMSKLYHPDTTALPPAIATTRFQQLNEAYATLSSPERRLSYDHKIGYSRLHVMQPPADLNRPVSRRIFRSSSAYLDPTDRPLSAGEIFALFILGLTFIACLILVITIGVTRGETAFQPPVLPTAIEVISPASPTLEDHGVSSTSLGSSLPFPEVPTTPESDSTVPPDNEASEIDNKGSDQEAKSDITPQPAFQENLTNLESPESLPTS